MAWDQTFTFQLVTPSVVFQAVLFERTVLSPPQASAALTQIHPDVPSIFKDSYLLEFLDLPAAHSEAELHHGLLLCLRDFLIELGRDFCFIGTEFPLQVGGRDFALDLNGVQLTHYRLQKQREQDLELEGAKGESGLNPGGEFGGGRVREKELEPLSRIITRMNDLFAAENLSDAGKFDVEPTFCRDLPGFQRRPLRGASPVRRQLAEKPPSRMSPKPLASLIRKWI